MGKKGKKKGASSATKAEKEQKRVARLSLIDKYGRMPREDGIKFYALLDFVAHIVIDDVERERRMNDSDCIPLHWPDRDGLQRMPDSTRTIVLSYIWKHINRITDEIDDGVHDGLFLRKVGRRIQDADKDEIRSWRNHIEDDFVVINHVPHVGSIFVQVGRVVEFEQKGLGPVKDDADIHEPRVFCVQGLATSMQEMCENSHGMLVKAYPSLKKYDLPVSFLHTTLLQYNKGITYAVTAEQTNRSYYETAQQYAEAVKIAHECYRSAILKDQTTNIQCELYDSITPDIVRRAWEKGTNSSYEHEKWLRDEVRPDDRPNDPEMSCLLVHGMIWMPFANSAHFTDPRTMTVIQEIMSERPMKVIREGFKHRITYEVWFNDHEPCPFHRRLGADDVVTPSFAECCKKDHLKRVAKAKKRDESLICTTKSTSNSKLPSNAGKRNTGKGKSSSATKSTSNSKLPAERQGKAVSNGNAKKRTKIAVLDDESESECENQPVTTAKKFRSSGQYDIRCMKMSSAQDDEEDYELDYESDDDE